jgi:glycosyltransferase involved in cell wall biosynthesis
MKQKMETTHPANILVDCREFLPDQKTGIGRVLEGLLESLDASMQNIRIILLGWYFPNQLIGREKIKTKKIPQSFISSEKTLSQMTKHAHSLFISPYPKLPLFGTHCPAINMVHDVLDLTHPAYRRRIKVLFDAYRLKSALQKANLTWYVSSWSLRETERYAGFTGNNPRIRYNGIEGTFSPYKGKNEKKVLMKYGLEPGYVLVIGNGLPHKNLGVILEIEKQMKRNVVFVGVSIKNQTYWKLKYANTRAIWISHVEDDDLPSIIRSAFCLAQPSTMEGYGYPPLEAMACGVPSIVSDIPVLRETTGGNSLFADPQNPSNWIRAFNLLEDPDRYQHQIQKARDWIEPLIGKSAWENHISDIRQLLRY